MNVSVSGTLTLPRGNASVVYLVHARHGQALDLVLPAAATAVARLVTVRNLEARGRVIVRAASGDSITALTGADARGMRHQDIVVLEGRFDYVTLATDGRRWLILAERP